MSERLETVGKIIDSIQNPISFSSAIKSGPIVVVVPLEVVDEHVAVELEAVVADQSNPICRPSLKVVVNPIDKIVESFVRFGLRTHRLAAFEQLPLLLVDLVNGGGLFADAVLRVDEPLEGGRVVVLCKGQLDTCKMLKIVCFHITVKHVYNGYQRFYHQR